MKRLALHIILFLLPVFIAITFLPVNGRHKFIGIMDDCFGHGMWIYDRIHHNPAPVDIAFLGSSHTLNGINDKLISDSIPGIEASNFGYSRLGRNLHYSFLKEIISEKKIKKLVIEVRELENRSGHPIFPFVADTRDVFLPNLFFNQKVFSDAWEHAAFKIELTQDQLFHQTDSVPFRNGNYGGITTADTISAQYLEEVKTGKSKPAKIPPKFIRNYYNNFSRVYLNKIASLCADRNIDIYFLYLPAYGSAYPAPRDLELYEHIGPVIIPPDSIYGNKNCWYDHEHMNKAGAKSLAVWLAGVLEKDVD